MFALIITLVRLANMWSYKSEWQCEYHGIIISLVRLVLPLTIMFALIITYEYHGICGCAAGESYLNSYKFNNSNLKCFSI